MVKKILYQNLKKKLSFYLRDYWTKLKDLIKFLLNLNIEVSIKSEEDKNESSEKKDYKKVGRNEKCPCGSGKKFKHCHGNI